MRTSSAIQFTIDGALAPTLVPFLGPFFSLFPSFNCLPLKNFLGPCNFTQREESMGLASRIVQLLPSRQNPPLPPPLDLEHPSPQPHHVPPNTTDHLDHKYDHLEWQNLIVGFCLATASEIAVQTHMADPAASHLLRLWMVLSFSSVLVAKHVAHKSLNAARVLEHVGGLFGITAFFLAITTSFPLWLKVISWIIYALALIVICICNCRFTISWC